MVFHLAVHEHDAITQQPRINVEAAFAAVRAFDDNGNQAGNRIEHGNLLSH
jgi:hypothetical protein